MIAAVINTEHRLPFRSSIGESSRRIGKIVLFAARFFIAALVIALVIAGRSHAGNATISDSDDCAATLTGIIAEGDVEKITRALMSANKIKSPDNSYYPGRGQICLNSDGGSFEEGMKLAQFFFSNRLGTVITENIHCLSACAIAFMGGSGNDTWKGYIPSRKMHVTGVLGFHAPYIVVQEGNYNEETVNSAYQVATAAIGELLEFGKFKYFTTSGSYVFDPSIIAEMLKMGKAEIYFIDTIEKARQAGIEIYGYEKERTITNGQYVNICYYIDRDAVGVSYADRLLVSMDASKATRSKDSNGWTEISGINFGFESINKCVVKYKIGYRDLEIQGYLKQRYNEEMHGVGDFTIPEWWKYPPKTPLTCLLPHAGEECVSMRNEAMPDYYECAKGSDEKPPACRHYNQEFESDDMASGVSDEPETAAVQTLAEDSQLYVIQVASFRNEEGAQKARQQLQLSFGKVLGSSQLYVSEVNLGSNGTWFRVRIGPPISKELAASKCQALVQVGLKDCQPMPAQ